MIESKRCDFVDLPTSIREYVARLATVEDEVESVIQEIADGCVVSVEVDAETLVRFGRAWNALWNKREYVLPPQSLVSLPETCVLERLPLDPVILGGLALEETQPIESRNKQR
jgi:hypothetical protein